MEKDMRKARRMFPRIRLPRRTSGLPLPRTGGLYAIALGWPSDGKLVVKSLAKNAPNFPGEIRAVKLLGSSEKLVFARDETGLIVTVPNRKPCEYAYVLKITGQ
jgi:alpha-L-fucosidase